MKTLRYLAFLFLCVQVMFLIFWIVPGLPMNDTAWGLVLLPTFIFLALAFLGLGALLLLFLMGFVAWAVSENKK